MVAIIVGLGSMGRRRIRLIHMKYPDTVIMGVDTRQDRRLQSEEQLSIKTFDSIEAACEAMQPNIGFVCTSPLSHCKIIPQLLEREIHVFTEINLVDDGYDEMMNLAKKNNLVLFLSSTFLYRNDIAYIKERVQEGRVNYCLHVGQYLPDWHPWENYKDFFAINSRTNGCREHFAIDMPWMIDVFGEIESFYTVKGKLSKLEVDYNDNYIVTFVHKNGNKGVMLNDIIARVGARKLEVYSENLHLFWEGSPDSLYVYDIDKKEKVQVRTYDEIDKNYLYNASIIENAYLEEIVDFVNAVETGSTPKYSFEQDRSLLTLIDKIEGLQ